MEGRQEGTAAARVARAGRLVYYRARPDAAFWAKHWRSQIGPEFYRGAESGVLGELEAPLLSRLPREGKILEAGCGLGQVVLALRRRGYDCEGVEWAEEAVALARAQVPDLPVRAGDVTKLGVPDGTYAAVLSLGVVEHAVEGPEAFLVEARRVLQPDGLFVVTVPHFNLLRRLRALAGRYAREAPPEAEFYQYAFAAGEMRARLRASGFRPVERFGYGVWKCLKDDGDAVRPLFRLRGIGWRLERRLCRSPGAAKRLGHMLGFACRKA